MAEDNIVLLRCGDVSTELRLPSYLDSSRVPAVAPAPRKASINKIMLIDNGHLAPTFGAYQVLFDVLSENLLARFPNVDIQTYVADRLSSYSADQLAEVVSLCTERGVDAVVIALCDIGASAPSTRLASALERAGIPVCLICQGIGVQLVQNAARMLGQTIPFVTIKAMWCPPASSVRPEALRVLPDSFAALLEPQSGPKKVRQQSGESNVLSLDNARDLCVAFSDYMTSIDLSDGLPMVAPTAERVRLMLDAIGLDESKVIWPSAFPRTTPVTVRDIATVAVIAGCKPQWGWAVIAAYEAMADPAFNLHMASVTSHPSGTFVLISGPKAVASGIAAGPGCLGPGYPANATIGRAVALAYRMFLGAVQGASDITIFGSPAEFTFCCAENVSESPWPSFTEALRGRDGTSVTVLKCEGPRKVGDRLSATPEGLLDTLAAGMTFVGSNNSAISKAETVVLMNPNHANFIAQAGWGRRDVQRYLFERARVSRKALEGHGTKTNQAVWFRTLDLVPIVETPDDILVVVAGGFGQQSAVLVPWGYSRAVTVVV